MPSEDSIRAELVGLLRYANKTKIAEQLGVSPQAVKNWAEGRYPSEDRLNAIKRLYGLPVGSQGTNESAPPPEGDGAPQWALELTDKILSEIEQNRKAILEQVAGLYAALVELLLGPDSDDGGLRGSTGPQPKRPGPGTGRST